jgi:hypothetical protein
LALTLGIRQPVAAQIANRPFADLSRYLRMENTFAAQAPVDSHAPVVSLGALSARVKPFEKIYVRTASGEEIAGTFSRASDASLTMEVHGQTREIPTSEVRQVSRRGGEPD